MAAGWICATAVLMLNYGMRGKFRHRERLLAKVNWRGDEQVLDVGTGRGLLLIGVAKRLTTGHATGIEHLERRGFVGQWARRAEGERRAGGRGREDDDPQRGRARR